mgnify:CR=1 FL=1
MSLTVEKVKKDAAEAAKAQLEGAGAKVTLCVRPECWSLSDRQPASNWVRGRIGEAVYLGELAQYALQAGGQTLKVIELNPRFLEKSGQGEVYARAEPDDVVVLAD